MGLIPYIGGDTRIAGFILRLLPSGSVLVEPFGGGGAVSLLAAELSRYRRIVWNDKDFYIYSAFYVIKYHPEIIPAIHDALLFLRRHVDSTDRESIKFFLKQIRDELRSESVRDVVEAGFLTHILYNTCHVPFKSGIMLRWTDNPRRYKNVAQKLMHYHRILQRVEIMNRDAFDLIPEFDREDVVMYVDPPHIVPGTIDWGYYRLCFSPQDAVKLDKLLASLKHAKILIKLSQHDIPYYRNIARTWNTIKKSYIRDTKPGTKPQKLGTYHFFMNYTVSTELTKYIKAVPQVFNPSLQSPTGQR